MGKRVPTALNYWEGWAIGKAGKPGAPFKFLLILGPDEEEQGSSMREIDPIRHTDRISRGDIDYICGLIEESAVNWDDPLFKRWLPIHEKRWSLLATSGDREAREKLERLHRIKKGDLRGTLPPETLKNLIRRDIQLFRYIVSEKEKRTKKKTIEKIIFDATNLHTDSPMFDISPEAAWRIYKAYNRVAEKCLPILQTWQCFFDFLEHCRQSIGSPVTLVYYKTDLMFVKGEIKGNTLTVSW